MLRKVPLGKKESSNTVREASQHSSRSLAHNRVFAAVSPVRQRAAKNLFRGYLFNGYRRLSSQVGYWIVPVVLGTFPSPLTRPDRLDTILSALTGYSTYAWAKKYDAYLNSKEGHLAQAGEH